MCGEFCLPAPERRNGFHHESGRIVVVVHGKRGRKICDSGIAAQKPRAERVKRAYFRKARSVVEGDRARAHFVRGFFRKGYREYGFGRDFFFGDEVGDLCRNDARLSASRSCENQKRTGRMFDRLSLFGIERFHVRKIRPRVGHRPSPAS